MGILTWVVFGLLAGFIASMLVNKNGASVVSDIVLGVTGATVGGFIAQVMGLPGMEAFNPWSFLVAVGGSIVVLSIYHAVIWSATARI